MSELRQTADLPGLIQRIADQKRLAAQSRTQPRDPNVEPAADVFASSCQRICAEFEPQGFRYFPSRNHATRKRGEWRDTIWFFSSHYNISGISVQLETGVMLQNSRLGKWRKAHASPFTQRDQVMGGQISNLSREKQGWITWDVAAREARDAVIADIVHAIRTISLPYLDQFADMAVLRPEVEAGRIPWLDISDSIELLLCYSGKDAAEECVNRFLRVHADLIEALNECLAVARSSVAKDQPSGYAEQIAMAIHHYGLRIPSL